MIELFIVVLLVSALVFWYLVYTRYACTKCARIIWSDKRRVGTSCLSCHSRIMQEFKRKPLYQKKPKPRQRKKRTEKA
jgi:DNA-directed RNA polymerase subunit RPC12/RpoP